MSDRTYAELRRRAGAHLRAGRAVVIDATHGLAAHREAARQLAAEAGVPALTVELRLSDDAALARIGARMSDPLRTSDADEAVYRRQREHFEPIRADEGPRLAIDGATPPGTLALTVAEALPVASP
jgi:predicted kinase